MITWSRSQLKADRLKLEKEEKKESLARIKALLTCKKALPLQAMAIT